MTGRFQVARPRTRPRTRVPEVSERAAVPFVQSVATRWLFVGYITLLLIEYAGLARFIPPLQAVRFATLLSYAIFFGVLATVGIKGLMKYGQTKILFGFVVFTTLTVIWAIVQWYAVQAIRPLIDYMVLYVMTVALVDRQSRIDALSWLFCGVTAFLVALNIDKLVSAERSGAFLAPYFMGDGNDFAWGLVVMLPFMLNLVLGERAVLSRIAGLAGVGLCLFGVIGSGSRGAALGLASAFLYYWIVLSRRKALGAFILALVGTGILVFAPARYFERLESIVEYSEDNSAQARLQVWKAAGKMAIDYPFGVGAGNFSSAYGRYYMPAPEANTLAWGARRWLAAHSIYFKVLGEYGLIGLVMLLAILRRNLLDTASARRELLACKAPGAFNATWPALLSMSVVGYAICGVFLGGINYPHLFVLSALVVAIRRNMTNADMKPPGAANVRS